MKTKLLSLIFIGSILVTNAQTYSFTLLQNSDYNYTVAAVPDFNSGTDMPNLESFGTTIMLQDGATVDVGNIVFSYLSLDSTTFFDAATLDSSDPGQDRSATLIVTPSGVASLPAHDALDIIPLITFDVLGTPTTGEISILDNNSAVALAASGTLNSYFSIDPTGGTNAVPSYGGQTGTTSYSFSTLGMEENVLTDLQVSVYPNPASEYITISSTLELTKVEMFDLTGKRVLDTLEMAQLKINHLPTGLYFMKIFAVDGTLTKKIMID